MMLGQLAIYMEKNEDGLLYITSYTKINLKWTDDLNIRVKTLRLLQYMCPFSITLNLAMDFQIWQ